MALVLGGLTLLIVLGCLQTATADCQSGQNITQGMQECYTKNGLNYQLPSQDSIVDWQKYAVNPAPTQDVNLFCSKRDSYKAVLECTLNIGVCIMPDPYKGYVSNPANAGKMVDETCNGNVNLECIKNKTQEMIDCVKGKGSQKTSNTDAESMKNILCLSFQLSSECILTVMKSCGCATVKSQQTMAIDLMYPPACPAFQTTRAQCDATNPQLYTNSGEQRTMAWTMPLLVSSVFVLLKLLAM